MPSERPESEIARIEALLVEIERVLKRAPWLALSTLLALPVWWFFGGLLAAITALMALTATGIAIYIPIVHRVEHHRRLDELRGDG